MFSQSSHRFSHVLFVAASLIVLSACGGGGLKPPAPKTLSHILVAPGNAVIGKSKTLQLKAMGIYSDASQQDLTAVATWGTSQATIAAVNATGLVTGMTVGTAQVSAAYQGVMGVDQVTIQPPTLVSILISPSNPAIGKSKTLQLSATGAYSDGSQQDLTATATWGTTQAAIASVSAGGMVTGVAAGGAQISAVYQGVTGTDGVSIQSATLSSISISPSNPAIGKSKTLQLTATGNFSDGTQQDLTAMANWGTSQATIAAVSGSGMVTGMTAGGAQISAAYQGITGTDAVTIQPATVVSISISPGSPSVRKSKTLQLAATGTYSDGTQQDVTALAAWETAQPTIAAISSSGLVTGMAPGNAQVSAVYQSVTGTDMVTIQPPALISIAISPSNLALGKGQSFQLTATGSFGDGTQQDLTNVVNWTTNLPNIAFVAVGGGVTGMAAGSAQISATSQGVTGTDAITVQAPVLSSIAVNPKKSLLLIGESAQLAATGTWSDGSTTDVSQSATWSSSANAVSVGPSGSVWGKAAGKATIMAAVGSLSGTARVAVTSATAVALTIKPAQTTIGIGNGKQLSAIATLSDGSKLDITEWATWTSAQPKIADVTATGQAIGGQVGSAAITAAAAGVSATANITVAPQAMVNYFDLSGDAVSGSADTVRLTNPGVTGDNLCAMIYVFDENQELTECCGCTITDSGLRTLSLSGDLTSNPLIGTPPPNGNIKVVSSDPTNNPQCDPRSLSPAGRIVGWGTNSQLLPDGTTQITETQLNLSPLSRTAVSNLANLCSAVQQLGSGAGVCTCGTGD